MVLFLAAALFLLHQTLNPTCKLDMIALGFGVCVCALECLRLCEQQNMGPPHMCIPYIYPKGEPNTAKYIVSAWSCLLVSLGVACLSRPHVPHVLKAENYPHARAHAHLKKERKLPTDFRPRMWLQLNK